jgi:ABC-type transport system involved in multi-copper enzyme maturation permease subunit
MTITGHHPHRQAGQDGSGSRSGSGSGSARLVHAEWTKFRTLRGWLIAIMVAAVLIDAVAVLVPRGDTQCASGSGAACLPHVATGPGGEAVNDSYYLAAQPLPGDGSITVQVTSLTGMIQSGNGGFIGPDSPPPGTMTAGLVPWAKAGIIITDGTQPGAAYAAMMVTGSHGVRMQYDYTGDIAGMAGSGPRWLRLTRSGDGDGDVITGYDSADGTHWTQVGKVQLPDPGAVRAGMFATSPLDFTPNLPVYGEPGGSAANSVATGTFDDVSLSGGAPGGRWAGQYVGAGADSNGPQPAGIGLRQAGSGPTATFTVTGSGDIGPVVAAGVNSGYLTGTVADHLLGVFIALLVMIVIAAMFITVEYRRGLIRTTLAAAPRRGRLLAAKAVVIGGATFVLGSAAVAVAVIVGSKVARDSGTYVLPVSGLTQVRVIAGTGAMLAVASVLALSIGTMLRRSVVTVAAVIVAIVLPYILGVSGVLPASAAEWVLRVTPAAGFAMEQSVPQYLQVVGHYGPPDYFPLGPWQGLAVLCAYALAAFALAAWRLRRRDA